MKRLFVLLAAFSLAFVATGCGQSGPLYIPGNPSSIKQPPPRAESTAEEEDEENDEAEDET